MNELLAALSQFGTLRTEARCFAAVFLAFCVLDSFCGSPVCSGQDVDGHLALSEKESVQFLSLTLYITIGNLHLDGVQVAFTAFCHL